MVKYFSYIEPEFPLLQLVTIALVISVCISGKSLPLPSLQSPLGNGRQH